MGEHKDGSTMLYHIYKIERKMTDTHVIMMESALLLLE